MTNRRAKAHPADKPLNPREEVFVREMVATNGDRAAAIAAAGYAPSRAPQTAAELLARPHVARAYREAMDRVREQVEDDTGVSLAKVVKELAKLAFFDPRKLFNPDGSPVPITELDDQVASALAGLEVMEVFEGSGDERRFVGYLKKYRLLQRTQSLDMLMKHLGGYEKDHEQQGSAQARALAELHQFMAAIHETDTTRIRPATGPGRG